MVWLQKERKEKEYYIGWNTNPTSKLTDLIDKIKSRKYINDSVKY